MTLFLININFISFFLFLIGNWLDFENWRYQS